MAVAHAAQQHIRIHDMIRERSVRTPAAIAISGAGRKSLTYGELQAQITAVATKLRNFGIEETDVVVLMVPDGAEKLIGFLGITSVAACAPRDPSAPPNQLSRYLDSAPVRAVLKQQGSEFVVEPVTRTGLPTEPLKMANLALLLQTSGTTGRPKLAPLTHAILAASATNILRTLELSSSDRYLNVMPLHHVKGLMAALATLASGGTVFCAPGFSATEFFSWMEDFRPTWYTASPVIHQAILKGLPSHPRVIGGHCLRFIRSSTAALPVRVLEELEAAFRVPVLETWGMTETCSQATANPLPPGKRKPGSVGIPQGPELAILDSSGVLLPPMREGVVAVRGATVVQSYLHPEDNGAFIDGWLRSGDLGYIDAEGYVHITGRLNEIINHGGEKVSPHEVEKVLLAHPAVEECAVFGVPHPTLGQEIAAVVVPRNGFVVTESQLLDFAAEDLAASHKPRRIVIRHEIPKGQGGKIQRRTLHEELKLQPDPSQPPIETRSPDVIENELMEIWNDVLRVRPKSVADDFFLLGGDSLLSVVLLDEIEHAFGRTLDPEVLLHASTIEGLARAIRNDNSSSGRCLVSIKPSGSRHPLFLAHNSSGTVHGYRQLALHLGPDQPVYGLRMRGLDGRQDFHTSIEEMAAHYLEEIRSVQPAGPYYLGGHSFGGVVAFEMSQQLRARGEEVAMLALIDARPIGLSRKTVRGGYWFLWERLFRLRGHYEQLRRLNGAEKWSYLLGAKRRHLMRRTWEISAPTSQAPQHSGSPTSTTQAIYTLMQRYVPRVYSGRVIFFSPTEDFCNYHRGWRYLIAGGLEVHKVPGDHVSMIGIPNVGELAGALRARMGAAG